MTRAWPVLESCTLHGYRLVRICGARCLHIMSCCDGQVLKRSADRISFRHRCLREGQSYFMILKQLKRFDVENKFISEEALEYSQATWQFFDQRCGYIEINRNGRLEAICFPVTEDVWKLDDQQSLVILPFPHDCTAGMMLDSLQEGCNHVAMRQSLACIVNQQLLPNFCRTIS